MGQILSSSVDNLVSPPSPNGFGSYQGPPASPPSFNSTSMNVLNAIIADVSRKNSEKRYLDAVDAANTARQAQGDKYAGMQDALDRRGQDLTLAGTLKGDAAMQPILEANKVATNGLTPKFDAANLDKTISEAVKNRAEAANAGRSGKQPKLVYDIDTGDRKYDIPLTADQIPADVMSGIQRPGYNPNMVGDRTQAPAGGTAPMKQHTPVPAVVNVGGKATTAQLRNVAPRGDGTFTAVVHDSKRGQDRQVIVDSQGRIVGAAK